MFGMQKSCLLNSLLSKNAFYIIAHTSLKVAQIQSLELLYKLSLVRNRHMHHQPLLSNCLILKESIDRFQVIFLIQFLLVNNQIHQDLHTIQKTDRCCTSFQKIYAVPQQYRLCQTSDYPKVENYSSYTIA